MSNERKGGATLQGQTVDVVIHIGAPKTGSSAIQRFNLKNRKALLKAGYYYPKHFIDKNGVSGGHSILAEWLLGDKKGLAKLYFRYCLLKARLMNKTLLLSSESFCRSAAHFGPLLQGLNVCVVGWFRHPIEAFVSTYNQSVKRHFCTSTIEESFEGLIAKNRPAHLTGRRLHRWANVVGDERCVFIPYLDSFEGEMEQPIEERWLEAIGVPSQQLEWFEFDAKRINRSYVPEALELKRLLNVILKDDASINNYAIDWALQDYSDQADDEGIELGIYLDPEHVKRLSKMFRRSNEKLTERFPTMGPLLDKDEIFLRQAEITENRAPDLRNVLAHLRRSCPEELEKIRSRVSQNLASSGEISKELAELAGWLEVREVA
jgi:hypothetical protein